MSQISPCTSTFTATPMLRRLVLAHLPSQTRPYSSLSLLSMQHNRSPASAVPGSAPASKRPRNKKSSTASGASTPQFISTVAPPVRPPPAVQATGADAVAGRGFTETRFSDFLRSGAISACTAQGIKHEFCTPVQEATLPIILSGVDLYAPPLALWNRREKLTFFLPISSCAITETRMIHDG